MAHILIKTSGIRTELFIDGKKVNKVRKIAFEKKQEKRRLYALI